MKRTWILGAALAEALAWGGLSAAEPADHPEQPTALPQPLTPPAGPEPRIHGPKIFGVRPGHPFLYRIPATGTRPLRFRAVGLPAGLTLDAATGQLTGTLMTRGETVLRLQADNAVGQTERAFKIVCGDAIALTPPLGWNAWNCFNKSVTEAKIRSAADAMVSLGLSDHGWTYINVDDCWAKRREADGRIVPAETFSDMQALGAYLHGQGLKFGLYTSPGRKTCAQYVGSFQFEEQDARRYGEWGVDYVKYDDAGSYGDVWRERRVEEYCKFKPERAADIRALLAELDHLGQLRNRRTKEQSARLDQIQREFGQMFGKSAKDKLDRDLRLEPFVKFRRALDRVPRDIVYSINGLGGLDAIAAGANCWRTGYDISDTWDSVRGLGFSQRLNVKNAGPGHWLDPDMLVLGRVAIRLALHPTRLTPAEQYSHMSLWCLLNAPILLGCDLTQMDRFTLGLLTNDEVLDINQDSLGRPAEQVVKNGELEVWAKDLDDGGKAVGLFNLGSEAARVKASWQELHLAGAQVVRDVWRQQRLGVFDHELEGLVAPHGVLLVKIGGTAPADARPPLG